MLTFTCPDCGQEFHSEVDYEQHRMIERTEKVIEKAEKQAAGFRDGLSRIEWETRLNTLVSLMVFYPGLDFQGAMEKHKGLWEKLIARYAEMVREGKEQEEKEKKD